jgi:hypothetical protein
LYLSVIVVIFFFFFFVEILFVNKTYFKIIESCELFSSSSSGDVNQGSTESAKLQEQVPVCMTKFMKVTVDCKRN